MGLFGWLTRKPDGDERLTGWRRKWSRAVEAAEPDAAGGLATDLAGFGLPDDEVEVEREMLEALHDLVRARTELDRTGLPTVQTGHRVIGTDTCHFSAPAAMPDDQTQPAGRLLLTNARAVFAGGARATSLPWHRAGRVVQSDRDIVLISHDQQTMYRFRCNTYSDALRGALIARTLLAHARSGPSSYSTAADPPKHLRREC